ncbi:MAG: hypothetical protein ACD_2C00091G0014 [uncultured bacterium (gcode 4)]|uniref:Caib/baif family protein n=1 Tax=uncultured bacterium (gcode 4) TaxID=1234023 RepID=K2G3K9_9BACT|nr:MAG: hypothetical protein ACD_2C00091G0014 [uncultured bacterium (gcode 4)]
METIIETRICRCWMHFDITTKDLEFYEKISPVFNEVRYPIPSPSLCPDCRQQRRLSWRNERHLYKRTCDATWKEIISIYSPDKPYRVYNQKDWWSDRWNPFDYAREFDFNRSFFEQFQDLQLKVPRLSLVLKDNENIEYWNDVEGSKDCYLVFNAWDVKNSYYSTWVWLNSSDLMDCLWAIESTDCYGCIKINNAHNSRFCMDCQDISHCAYCVDCIWCRNCFWCAWSYNKQYCIFNEQYEAEDYGIRLKELARLNSPELKMLIKEKQDRIPRRFIHSESSEKILWDYFNNSENCISCYDMMDSEDCKYCYDGITKDTYDIFNCWTECSRLYECVSSYFSTQILSSNFCHSSKELFYCDHCYSSSDLFWCIGLIHKRYCILNKQYSKEEYERLVPEIIERMRKDKEWWEFFPSSISPFWYNETLAQEYYPTVRDHVISEELLKWSDYESPYPKVEKIIPASKLPLDIKDIPDDILNWALTCEITGKPYRIIKQELDFYRKNSLPIPRRHPDQRHLERMKLRNPRKLFDRSCDKCWEGIKTTYAPDRKEIVYCESCYNQELN